MDPEAALRELRAAIERFDSESVAVGEADNKVTEAFNESQEDYAREELATAQGNVLDAAQAIRDHAGALDEWLAKGGFLPAAWKRP